MNEIEILDTGAKQSKVAERFDLLEYKGVQAIVKYEQQEAVFRNIESAIYLCHSAASSVLSEEYNKASKALIEAMTQIELLKGFNKGKHIFGFYTATWRVIATVLAEGARKYEPRNWLGIPIESHINHVLNHLYCYVEGDTSEPHLDHALCRCFMAITLIEKI